MREFTGQCICGAVRFAAAARRYAIARKLNPAIYASRSQPG
jgi:hypothetical protein